MSVFEDTVACWKGESMSEWKREFIKKAKDFPIHKPYHQLDKRAEKLSLERRKKQKLPEH